ncbi:MAG: chromosomal replication initiator protein DnaA [Planctomycetes bacterium]|nr:chromosomal replication initiator protein DnaA [Planctomycetota bacterium]
MNAEALRSSNLEPTSPLAPLAGSAGSRPAANPSPLATAAEDSGFGSGTEVDAVSLSHAAPTGDRRARQTEEPVASATSSPSASAGDAHSESREALRPHDRERLQPIWAALQGALQRSLQREQFETWFRGATLARVDDATVVLAVQNSFARDWLGRHYAEALDAAIAQVFGGRRQLVLEVDPELTLSPRAARPLAPSSSSPSPAAPPPPAPATARDTSGRPVEAAARDGEVRATPRLLWSSDVTLNPNYRFDTFVVGPCNRFAHAASIGVSENPGKNYNPFFLHGSVGLGKTHLLQSLCATILERDPTSRILYLSCETFVNHFIAALESSDLAKFRNKYRNVDVLVVDDIHLLANKERTQEEFFHTFNTLYNAGKQIVLSSDSPPKEIPTLQERLVSRFKWGLVTEIEQPCYETRVAILKRKSKERGRELPDDVAAMLADQLETNIRELEGAVTRLIGFASLNNQPLNCEIARRVLRDVFATSRGQPSMEDIQRVVTAHFNVKLTDLQSRKRTNAIALPRQVSMYLARKITRHSLEEIGGFFGGRDHSTVLYAIEKVEGEMKSDARFRELVAGFLTALQRANA